jgi:hypothetical protein
MNEREQVRPTRPLLHVCILCMSRTTLQHLCVQACIESCTNTHLYIKVSLGEEKVARDKRLESKGE